MTRSQKLRLKRWIMREIDRNLPKAGPGVKQRHQVMATTVGKLVSAEIITNADPDGF